MFLRRQLSYRLRAAREAAGFTQNDVAQAMEWSLSKVIRIETGAVGISVADLRWLVDKYGLAEGEAAELTQMVRASRQPAWWQQYRGVLSQSFQVYLGYEMSASIIRNFEATLIPGLLQTEEYAAAVLRKSRL